MNFKASFYMALNKIAGFVEACSDDESDVEVYRRHDCGAKWSFESLYVLTAIKLEDFAVAGVHLLLTLHRRWLRGARVSSPALTSLGPFLWQTFVTLRRAVCHNRLLTTSAVPSLCRAQIPDTATFIATQKPEEKTDSNSTRNTC